MKENEQKKPSALLGKEWKELREKSVWAPKTAQTWHVNFGFIGIELLFCEVWEVPYPYGKRLEGNETAWFARVDVGGEKISLSRAIGSGCEDELPPHDIEGLLKLLEEVLLNISSEMVKP